jgi:hypothetical protein
MRDVLVQFLFFKQQRLHILTTNRRRVPVGRGRFQFLFKCCFGKEDPVLLLHYSLHFVVVPSPYGGLVVLESSNIAPICLF